MARAIKKDEEDLLTEVYILQRARNSEGIRARAK